MSTNTVVHISTLRVGDVVRAVRGMAVREPGAEALFVPEDQLLPIEQRRRITETRGWRNPPLYGPDDFRQGYDTMTVMKVEADFVDFVRPYAHVYEGELTTGLEQVNRVPRTSRGWWYELLGRG